MDSRPALEALIALYKADERLRELRLVTDTDLIAIAEAEQARASATGLLALALGVSEAWPLRELRRRTRITEGWMPPKNT